MNLKLTFSAVLLTISQLVSAQCNETKMALKQLNNNELDKAILSLDSANVLIKEQGIENIDEKCLAKYYYARGATNFEKAKKEGDLETKIGIFVKSEENYTSFLKLNQQPEDLLKLTQSNLFSLAIEYLNVGVDLYQKQDYPKALDFMEKGIDIKKKHHPATLENQDIYNAMVCAKMSEKYEKALVYVDTLLNSKKITADKELEYLTQKVEILTAQGKNPEALEILKKLKELNPNNPNIKLTELQIYMNDKKNKEALLILEDLTNTIKDREDLFIVKGQLYFQNKELGRSISAFNSALQINPKSESALYGLGVVHVNQANEVIELMKSAPEQNNAENEKKLSGYYNSAIMYLDRIIAVNPKEKDTLNALVSIYRSMGNEAKMKENLDKLNALQVK